MTSTTSATLAPVLAKWAALIIVVLVSLYIVVVVPVVRTGERIAAHQHRAQAQVERMAP